MPQRFPVLVAVALFAAFAPPARAAIVVPDNYPTIQAAIDALPNGGQIYVRDGTYPENLTIGNNVSVEPTPPGFDYEGQPQSYPRLLGSIQISLGSLRGFQVMGSVLLGHRNGGVALSECRVDSGITGGQVYILSIRGCLVQGGVNVSTWYGEITNNTVLGGGIRSFAEGGTVIRGNYVQGPAAVGIATIWWGGSQIIANSVVGCTLGIDVFPYSPPSIFDNVVSDCSDAGIRLHASTDGPGFATVAGNVVERCGRHGLEFHDLQPAVTGNTLTDVGGCGIWADLEGAIASSPTPAVFQGNRILRSGSDGMHLQVPAEIAANIVGRSGARGIVVLPTGTALNVHGNTSYWNARAGFDLSSDAGGTIVNNVAYANQREGLVWSGAPAPVLTCNDWYANVSGGTSGVLPGSTDLATDPFFCNVPQDDVHIAVFSPLRNTPGCGLIGALDVGCSEATAVADPRKTSAEFGCTPRPTAGDLRFSWPRLGAAGQIEVFDATGARRWRQTVDKGSEGQSWNASDDSGRRLSAGVYFARIKAGSYSARTRVVVLK